MPLYNFYQIRYFSIDNVLPDIDVALDNSCFDSGADVHRTLIEYGCAA